MPLLCFVSFYFSKLWLNDPLSRESYIVFKLPHTRLFMEGCFQIYFQTTEFYMAVGACIIICAVVLDLGFDRSSDKP